MVMSPKNKTVIKEYTDEMQRAEASWSMARTAGNLEAAERHRVTVETYSRMIDTLLRFIEQSGK